MILDDIREQLPENAGIFDNYAYDNSILGYTDSGIVVYDYESMIEELQNDTGWDEQDCIDWISINEIGSIKSYPQPDSPMILYGVIK